MLPQSLESCHKPYLLYYSPVIVPFAPQAVAATLSRQSQLSAYGFHAHQSYLNAQPLQRQCQNLKSMHLRLKGHAAHS